MTSPTPTRQLNPPEPQPIDATNAASAGVSILVQGPSGSGKSHFICSMPQPLVVGVTESNISVYTGRITEGYDIKLFPLKSWADYQWFVRKTKNREWDAATVGLDSYTVAGDYITKVQRAKPGALNSNGQLTWARWDDVKNEQFNELLDFLGATQPLAGKPTYNIVVAAHEYDEAIRNSDGEAVGISAVNPAVPGGLRKHFSAKFDAKFIVAQTTDRKMNPTTKVNEVTGVRHFLWTVPPDHLREVKDGIGGNGGRKVLPPTVENTWAALTAAWGK